MVKILSHNDEGTLVEVSVGDLVRDDITGQIVKVLEILDGDYKAQADGISILSYGLIVDINGGEPRYTWEVSEIAPKTCGFCVIPCNNDHCVTKLPNNNQ